MHLIESLGFLLFTLAVVCRSAPRKDTPPATTVVSGFRQALTSAEDESVETAEQSPIEEEEDVSSIFVHFKRTSLAC